MDITGQITGINYKLFLAEELPLINYEDLNINEASTSCLVIKDNNSFALSKWVSPKRTRSYPYERIYNTLSTSKKITVIPVVKDEGAAGDRDFLQWDTISLMSLLDVFVIFAYYQEAEKKENKITNQKFDNNYVKSKIKEIESYHSSALHWNLNELKMNLHSIIDKVQTSYRKIEDSTGVKLHGFAGIDNFKDKIGKDVSLFMDFSRGKAEKAQEREYITIQPKEKLSTLSKSRITIANYLGGLYFFTVDEIVLKGKNIFLIEGKHSTGGLLPSKGDIKDGLLKMILYSNLSKVEVNKKPYESRAILILTSDNLIGKISSVSSKSKIEEFFKKNNFSLSQINFVNKLFEEAQVNNFIVDIKEIN